MGMDSYLYSMNKSDFSNIEKLQKKHITLKEEINSIIDSISQKHSEFKENVCRETFEKFATKEQIIKVDSLYDELNKLDNDINDIEDEKQAELMYWRKPYGLHAYIVKNFWKFKEDNCVNIPLTKSNLQQILDEMNSCLNNGFKPYSDTNMFGENTMWSIDDLKCTINIIKNIMADYDEEENVIYYYSWY